MPTPEESRERVRAVAEKARAEGREATLDDFIPCIGEDITDRVGIILERDGRAVLLIDGEEAGPVAWL